MPWAAGFAVPTRIGAIDMQTTPEHLHVILNHVPMIGIAASGIPLLYGLIGKQRHAVIVGLSMLVIFAAFTPLVVTFGEEAEERFHDNAALAAMIDAAGMEWMHTHEDRAEPVAIIVYIAGGLGLLGLLATIARKKLQAAAAIVALIGCVVSVGGMAWVADAGGKIRHPEFRATPDAGPPGAAGSEADEHDDGEEHDDHEHDD
jgi:hypothetical protein